MALSSTSIPSPADVVTSFLVTSNMTDAIVYPAEYYNLKAVSSFLHKYYVWIIFAFGFPGNLISVFVIIHMSHQRLSVPLFSVALLAILDNMLIILKILKHQSLYNNIPMFESACRSMYFLSSTLAAYANWILVVMSAERFTAVRFPLKVKLFWSMRRLVTVIGAILVILLLAHVHFLFTITNRDNKCVFKPAYRETFYPGWLLLSSVLHAVLPAISITILNVFIIRLLRRSVSRHHSMSSEADSASVERRQQERQMTVMLVTLFLVFIALTIPHCIYVMYSVHWETGDDVGKERKLFVKNFTKFLLDSNHAVNFYLYFLSGRRFRKHFFDLVRKRFRLMKIQS